MDMQASSPNMPLYGVHHTARPTWKLKETVEFYRDKLGLPLVHAISARGWGPADHADFLHFFFNSGNGSTIAFFYYIGTERPEYLAPRDDYRFRATHTAWQVRKPEELDVWRKRLIEVGIPLRYETRHEIIESIYFEDPNGYSVEITCQLRPMTGTDARDAELTMDAAIALEQGGAAAGFTSIDSVWRRKGTLLEAEFGGDK
jgi:catechol 2,3-dioxygenase-like lactoylglutathione lyase family enzyme